MTKIPFIDLAEAADRGELPVVFGRSDLIARLDRIRNRRMRNNAVIIGPHGIGKTALIHGWARHLHERAPEDHLIALATEHLLQLTDDRAEEFCTQALQTLPRGVVFIDDFGIALREAGTVVAAERAYRAALGRADLTVVLAMEPDEYDQFARDHASYARSFEPIHLSALSSEDCRRVLRREIPYLNAAHRVIITDDALEKAVMEADRYPLLGVLPLSAIRLLDEAIAACAAAGARHVRSAHIDAVIESKWGISSPEKALDEIRQFDMRLSARIIDQDAAINAIASTLKRAKLGLRNPNRPLGSFLMLGPSGVGKTETAKAVAEILFGKESAMIRFDMSEFQQEHTVQRLIGAPAGYIGHDEGGALTNALKREPHSLILLDEIEKAHARVFDIFLQLLDDGRLTSGLNETVDGRHCIVMATSNAAVEAMLEARDAGLPLDDAFVKTTIMPVLAQIFRLEFLNRFDKIILFQPLSASSLIRIAELETRRIERRFEAHRVRFELDRATLEVRLHTLCDPRFGARPVKRFIEETCETLLERSLLDTAV